MIQLGFFGKVLEKHFLLLNLTLLTPESLKMKPVVLLRPTVCVLAGLVCLMCVHIYFILKLSNKELHTRTIHHMTRHHLISKTTHRRHYNRSVYPSFGHMKYILNNPDVCHSSKEVTVLFVVHSAWNQTRQRQVMRQTFLNQTYFPQHTVKSVFLLGLNTYNQSNEIIEMENAVHGDIIQGDFMDTYHNLTYKFSLGLQWMVGFCLNVKFVIKIDDDTVMDTFRFLERYLPKYQNKRRHLICNVWSKNTMGIIRKRRFAVSWDILKGYNVYPWRYCSGFVVVLTGDLIPLLYKSLFISPMLWVDDVYLSGQLPSRLDNVTYIGLRPQEMYYSYNRHFRRKTKCLGLPGCELLVFEDKYGYDDYYWKILLYNRGLSTIQV
ncbi:beta-1,3-galactosyltransferase 1-like [Haliotis cracherodii]|uniref:beta-1,3-galactosyltransferase 1-like n=1 Tax=Haliotis cracherodii TaxID=6455 RepID=UPI0039E98219